jgi:hypothetical protein
VHEHDRLPLAARPRRIVVEPRTVEIEKFAAQIGVVWSWRECSVLTQPTPDRPDPAL